MTRTHLFLAALVSVTLISGCGAKPGPADGTNGENADGSGAGLGQPGAGESDLGGAAGRAGGRYGSGGYGADGSGRDGLLPGEPVHRIFFELNSESVSDEAARILTDNARWIQKRQVREVIVEGHCDERGTREYNLALGQKRAESVKQFLGTQGVDWKIIRTISFGKEKPLVQGHDDFSWSQNRRAEIVLR
jgi:peptidoglycan-associated lipoprotein